MARLRITEYCAKKILENHGLMSSWRGFSATNNTTVENLVSFFGNSTLVVKVDEGIKKRGKLGLVKVGIDARGVVEFIKKGLREKHSRYIVESLVSHTQSSERYLSIERVRDGMKVLYSAKGGIEVEHVWEQVTTYIFTLDSSNTHEGIPAEIFDYIEKLIEIMNEKHFSFLEINPLVVDTNIHVLDCAVEVDGAALSLTGMEDVQKGTITEKKQYEAENSIAALDVNTPASLKFTMLNQNGSIWMLLSGGGASLVLADEVADSGMGNVLSNYGEYSGSPSTEDTYFYTKAILTAMLRSIADKKILIIAGGVANFTDVAKTFTGIIRALKEKSAEMRGQKIKVFVRRGGPNQEKGLQIMKEFLEQESLLGSVDGPQVGLTAVVHKAIKYL